MRKGSKTYSTFLRFQDADESALDDDNDESMVQSEDDSESEGSDEDEVSKLRRQLEKMVGAL